MSGKIQILCAFIAAVATIGASYIMATASAEKKATEIVEAELEKLDVVIAGYVDSNGHAQHEKGLLFDVRRVEKGTYKIIFSEPMPVRPVVVATSDGGEEGANIRVLSATRLAVTLEGRNYSSNGKSDTAFNFLVITPKTE